MKFKKFQAFELEEESFYVENDSMTLSNVMN